MIWYCEDLEKSLFKILRFSRVEKKCVFSRVVVSSKDQIIRGLYNDNISRVLNLTAENLQKKNYNFLKYLLRLHRQSNASYSSLTL